MRRPSLIPAGVQLEGEIEGEGDLIVRGLVVGPIHVDGGLVIEEGGMVRGHVHARTVTVRGAVKGNAFADEAIRVEASGRLVGDLTAPRVRVVPGARFTGQVHVQALDVPPPLRTYDPALHTFTGQLAPGPVDEALARGVSLEGAAVATAPGTLMPPPDAVPEPLQEHPTQRIRERPSRARGREPHAGEPQRPEPQRFEPQRPEPQRPEPQRSEPQRPEAREAAAEPAPAPADPSPLAAPRTRMPRIGRARASRRGRHERP